MDYDGLPYFVEPMQLDDVDEVIAIERATFPLPWSSRSYRRELADNEYCFYFVARKRDAPQATSSRWRRAWQRVQGGRRQPILGYGGFWLLVNEAHISTIAVRPEWQRRHIGELLLVTMLDRAIELNAEVATLEVRVSNVAAQALYHKYGFAQVGLKLCYYNDNAEDALIMATERLTSAAYQARYQQLKRELRRVLTAS